MDPEDILCSLRDTKLAEIVPAASENMPIVVKHDRVGFTKSHLLDRLRVEDVFGYLLGEGANFTHLITLQVTLRQAKLSNVGSAPSEESSSLSDGSVVIASASDEHNFLLGQAARSD